MVLANNRNNKNSHVADVKMGKKCVGNDNLFHHHILYIHSSSELGRHVNNTNSSKEKQKCWILNHHFKKSKFSTGV